MHNLIALLVFGVALTCGIGGCASTKQTSHSSSTRPNAQLQLQVKPLEDAEVYVDGTYQGYIGRWREQTLPVVAGAKRIEIRAPGHITRRFDVNLEPGEMVTLRVTLEPQWDEVPEPVKRSPSRPSQKRDNS